MSKDQDENNIIYLNKKRTPEERDIVYNKIKSYYEKPKDNYQEKYGKYDVFNLEQLDFIKNDRDVKEFLYLLDGYRQGYRKTSKALI